MFKNKKANKFLVILIALTMLAGLVPTGVFANDGIEPCICECDNCLCENGSCDCGSCEPDCGCVCCTDGEQEEAGDPQEPAEPCDVCGEVDCICGEAKPCDVCGEVECVCGEVEPCDVCGEIECICAPPSRGPRGAGDTWTVTLNLGAGTTEVPNQRIYLAVPEGTELIDIAGFNYSDPPARAGWFFVGWMPVINAHDKVYSDLTYTAQWIQDFTTPSPGINHQWSYVLNTSAFSYWKIPQGALRLTFNDVSLSGQTYLDYAYLTVDSEGNASIYFLCLAKNGRISAGPAHVDYLGKQAVLLAHTIYPASGSPSSQNEYSVWKLDFTEDMIQTIINGGTLSGTFNFGLSDDNNGHSILNKTLTFTNVTVVVEHYTFINDPSDAALYRRTPYIGLPGQHVTATPITIFGHVFDEAATQTHGQLAGDVPQTGSLTLRLYYKSTGEYKWEIRSVIEGLEAHTLYNGQQQKLSDVVSPSLLDNGNLFKISWPEDDDDPDAVYVFIGSVVLQDPARTDVGSVTQNFSVIPGYKILYRGDKHSAGYTPVLGPDGFMYEDITFAMGPPGQAPGTLYIDQLPIVIETFSDSKEYDGTPLTKADDYELYYYTKGVYTPGPTINTGTWVYDVTSKVDYLPGEKLVNNETIGFTIIGSQTNVGTSDNDYEIVWAGSMNTYTANERNYFIYQETIGELEVTRRPITITAASDSKAYDGSALTNSGYNITGGTIATGDTLVSVVVTGSQTYVGSSANVPSSAVILDDDEIDVTDNYDITYVNGTLTITNSTATLTITAASDNKEYDGTALTNSGFTTSTLPAGITSVTATVVGSQTNAGSSANEITAYTLWNGTVNVTSFFPALTRENGGLIDGTLRVDPRPLEITADSDSKAYDGSALTNDGYSITAGMLVTGDTLVSVVVTGSRTNAGSSANVPSLAVILDDDGNDVTDNYAITYVNGTLTITAASTLPLTITAASDNKVYDGTALTNSNYTPSTLPAGITSVTATVVGSQTNVGSGANEITAYTLWNGTEDVTSFFPELTHENGGLVDGTLRVDPRPLEITAASDSKAYDGSALTNDGYNVTDGTLVTGDTLVSVVVMGSQTYVGSSNNVPSLAVILDDDGNDVTDNYAITYVNGTLTITNSMATLTITAASDDKIYDGTALTNNDYTPSALPTGITSVTATVVGSQTNVGSSANEITAYTLWNGTVNVTSFFTPLTVENGGLINGTLTVTKRPLEITADSDSKAYDGSALTNGDYSITGGTIATGDTLVSVVVTGSQTYVGSSNNVPSLAVILDDDGNDVTDNYAITYVNGTLTITNSTATLTITAASANKIYDGTALTNNGYTPSTLPAGITSVTATVVGSQTNVGSSDNEITSYTLWNGTVNVTSFFPALTIANGGLINGTLTVTKRPLEITAASDSKSYDGSALTNSGFSITGGTTTAPDQYVDSVVVTGSQTYVGSSNNVPSLAVILDDDGNDVTDNYAITYVNGTLTITNSMATLTITAASDNKEYDGTALTNNGYTPSTLPAGITSVTATVAGSQTNVGSSANEITAYTLWNGTVNVTSFFPELTIANGGLINGTLTVTKRPLEITAASDSKSYDGSELTNDGYSITAGTLAPDQYIDSVVVTGTRTNVGSSPNVPSNAVIQVATGTSLTPDNIDVTANYNITYVNGTLTITTSSTLPLTITATSDNKEYDGTALTNSNYTPSALPTGITSVTATVVGSQTNVGDSANQITSYTLWNGTDDVTSFFPTLTRENGGLIDGTLRVDPRPLEITAASDSRAYNGSELTNSGYSITAGTLATGDTLVSVVVTGSQTNQGSSPNVPSNAVIQVATGTSLTPDNNDVTANYNITYINGTLTITTSSTLPLTIMAASDSKIYNGTALSNNGYTPSVLPAGITSVTATVVGSQTNVGSSANQVTAYTLWNGTEDVTSFFPALTRENGGLIDGTLRVDLRPITITAASDSRAHNGSALTNSGYSITAGTLATGDTLVSVVVTGSQTNQGSSPNVPSNAIIQRATSTSLTTDNNDVTANYNITYINGTLTITAGGGGGTIIPPTDPPIVIIDPDPPKDPEPKLDIVNHFAYIIGYEDGTVRPRNNITRAEVATIFFRLLTPESRAEYWKQTNDFSDVSPNAWHNNAISTLANDGILQGYPDGTFRPNATITRAELATIAVRFYFNGDTESFPSGLEGFSDISGHWAENYIKLAHSLGYVNGYPDGSFRPNTPITRAEMATLINNVLERLVESEEDMLPGMKTWPDNPAGPWYYYAIQEATNSHYFDRKAADPSASQTGAVPEKWTELRVRPEWSLLEKPTSRPEDLVY